jgi:hypothetical protein
MKRMTIKEALEKINQLQEPDTVKFTIKNTPKSLINFWINYKNIK